MVTACQYSGPLGSQNVQELLSYRAVSSPHKGSGCTQGLGLFLKGFIEVKVDTSDRGGEATRAAVHHNGDIRRRGADPLCDDPRPLLHSLQVGD